MANGEDIFSLFWGLCGSASVRDLVYVELYGQISVHDLNYWNLTLKVAYRYMEIYLHDSSGVIARLQDSVPNGSLQWSSSVLVCAFLSKSVCV